MMNKQQLGNTLWGMVDTILRNKVEDYKPYVLSLLFFKRLSDNYQWEIESFTKKFEKEHGKKPTQKQLQIIIKEAHDFIIPKGCFWEDVIKSPLNKINQKLNDAVTEITEANSDILPKGIINSAKWNEPAPDGSGGKRLAPELLQALLNYLDPVELDNSNVSPDILGDAYEYLIKKFADENKGGKVAGQFYTPQEIVEIIVRYLKPKKGEHVYDPTCGSGGMLIRSAKYVREKEKTAKGLHLFGQEDVWNTWAIANINMVLHALDAKIEKGDTLKDPKFKNGAEIDKFDMVAANFPFSDENWWDNGSPKRDAKGRPVLKKDGSPQLEYPSKDDFEDPYNRFIYGIPDFSNGDFAFIQHIIASLNDKGRAGVVCPQGVLFRGQSEKTEEDGQNRKADDKYLIRRKLLKGISDEGKNLIDAIVVLPKNIFYGTPIPGSIIFFNKNKPKERKDKVLMIYAAWDGWYKEAPNLNMLMPHDVMRIIVQLESWGDIEIAEKVIPEHEVRLNEMVDENLEFKIAEIELDFAEEQSAHDKMVEQLKDKKLDEKTRRKLEADLEKLLKKLVEKDEKIADVKIQAEKEKEEIQKVKKELLEMFGNPELRKRYFAVVDMEEIEENEFNLNIPRYVDTFEPEEEIDLKEATKEFKAVLNNEKKSNSEIEQIISDLKNG